MGFDVELNELNDFMVDSCEILVISYGPKNAITGKPTKQTSNTVDIATCDTLFPCRKEPAVLNARPETRKFEKNNEVVKATHRVWLFKEVVLNENDYQIRNINGDGKTYDILFIERFPEEEGTRLQEVLISELRN